VKLEHALAFDRFVLDPVAGGLYCSSEAVALTPKALALLEYLAENAGRLVSKCELLDALWPRRYVTDGVLKVSVREIRRALEDNARSPRFIETAHRRGYRFIARTEAVAPAVRVGFAVRPAAGHAAHLAWLALARHTNSQPLSNKLLKFSTDDADRRPIRN
jgi:DNA-binding winged helix-turn-helix (wHTH) protein